MPISEIRKAASTENLASRLTQDFRNTTMKELKEFDYFNAWLIFFLVATVGGGGSRDHHWQLRRSLYGSGRRFASANDESKSADRICTGDPYLVRHISRRCRKVFVSQAVG